MQNGIEMVCKAIEIIEDPDNCTLEHDEDGAKVFALNGKGINASMLLYVFQEGIRDGYIRAEIDELWPTIGYWNKLIQSIQ